VEQLNIVGKRSGKGVVTHRETMANVLSRGLADRLTLMDFAIGRKGLLNYIKSLAGSNIVKIVPDGNGSASDDADCRIERLKVVCGAFQSYLPDMAWIGDATAHSTAEVRFCSANTLTPNIGSLELAEAISRVLPFTASDETRPVLNTVLFEASMGKLRIVAGDGYTLSECTLDFETGDAETVRVLVDRASLKPIPSALRKAKRVRLSFGKAGDALDGMAMYVDTEVSRYSFVSMNGTWPDYERVIPSSFVCTAQVDTHEALKAVAALKVTAENPKEYAVDFAIGDGKAVLTNVDERGEVAINADSGDQSAIVRLDGAYFATAMRVIGGMTDFHVGNASEPVMLTAEGLRIVIMPMASPASQRQQRERAEVEQPEAETVGETEPIEPEDIDRASIEAEAEISEVEQPQAEQPQADVEIKIGKNVSDEARAIANAVIGGNADTEAEKPKRTGRRNRQPVATA